VYNYYGSREVNNLAAECPRQEGLHMFASGRLVEVVDDRGNWVAPGEIGQLAVTDLTNLSFPFIRYLNGDTGIKNEQVCSCGRGYPLLSGITGRTFEILTFGGKYLHGHFFAHLFLGYKDVRQFQVIQESGTLLVIKIVAPNKDINLKPILDRIQAQVGPEVKIEVTFVDNIPPLKSGKYRYTINKTVYRES
jgi:phenylacetate-CoA ligase